MKDETTIETERDEFDVQLQIDIRYIALQSSISSLSGRPLTPKGQRMLQHYIAERDTLRLAGETYADELFV